MDINLKFVLEKFGKLYSIELGVNLKKCSKKEVFKWFLASLLFGARISENTAKNTYRMFQKYHLLSPKKIIDAGWDFLVNPIMREGGYVRYDGKTSNELIRVSQSLIRKYKGDLNSLHCIAEDSRDLEHKLQEFYSVGPVTTRIFLRELRGVWEKANPIPGKYVRLAAEKLGIPSDLEGLRQYWASVSRAQLCQEQKKKYDFRNFEVALLRLGKNFFHKGKQPPHSIFHNALKHS